MARSTGWMARRQRPTCHCKPTEDGCTAAHCKIRPVVNASKVAAQVQGKNKITMLSRRTLLLLRSESVSVGFSYFVLSRCCARKCLKGNTEQEVESHLLT
eukprot:534-Heterococcus_DN1.PRE.1